MYLLSGAPIAVAGSAPAAADPSQVIGRVKGRDNQLHCARVLEVRIQSPPAGSPLRTQFGRSRFADDIAPRLERKFDPDWRECWREDVGRWEGGGTHTGPAFADFLIGSLPAASGRKMHFTGTTVLRVENGKIAEEIGWTTGPRRFSSWVS